TELVSSAGGNLIRTSDKEPIFKGGSQALLTAEQVADAKAKGMTLEEYIGSVFMQNPGAKIHKITAQSWGTEETGTPVLRIAQLKDRDGNVQRLIGRLPSGIVVNQGEETGAGSSPNAKTGKQSADKSLNQNVSPTVPKGGLNTNAAFTKILGENGQGETVAEFDLQLMASQFKPNSNGSTTVVESVVPDAASAMVNGVRVFTPGSPVSTYGFFSTTLGGLSFNNETGEITGKALADTFYAARFINRVKDENGNTQPFLVTRSEDNRFFTKIKDGGFQVIKGNPEILDGTTGYLSVPRANGLGTEREGVFQFNYMRWFSKDSTGFMDINGRINELEVKTVKANEYMLEGDRNNYSDPSTPYGIATSARLKQDIKTDSTGETKAERVVPAEFVYAKGSRRWADASIKAYGAIDTSKQSPASNDANGSKSDNAAPATRAILASDGKGGVKFISGNVANAQLANGILSDSGYHSDADRANVEQMVKDAKAGKQATWLVYALGAQNPEDPKGRKVYNGNLTFTPGGLGSVYALSNEAISAATGIPANQRIEKTLVGSDGKPLKNADGQNQVVVENQESSLYLSNPKQIAGIVINEDGTKWGFNTNAMLRYLTNKSFILGPGDIAYSNSRVRDVSVKELNDALNNAYGKNYSLDQFKDVLRASLKGNEAALKELDENGKVNIAEAFGGSGKSKVSSFLAHLQGTSLVAPGAWNLSITPEDQKTSKANGRAPFTATGEIKTVDPLGRGYFTAPIKGVEGLSPSNGGGMQFIFGEGQMSNLGIVLPMSNRVLEAATGLAIFDDEAGLQKIFKKDRKAVDNPATKAVEILPQDVQEMTKNQILARLRNGNEAALIYRGIGDQGIQFDMPSDFRIKAPEAQEGWLKHEVAFSLTRKQGGVEGRSLEDPSVKGVIMPTTPYLKSLVDPVKAAQASSNEKFEDGVSAAGRSVTFKKGSEHGSPQGDGDIYVRVKGSDGNTKGVWVSKDNVVAMENFLVPQTLNGLPVLALADTVEGALTDGTSKLVTNRDGIFVLGALNLDGENVSGLIPYDKFVNNEGKDANGRIVTAKKESLTQVGEKTFLAQLYDDMTSSKTKGQPESEKLQEVTFKSMNGTEVKGKYSLADVDLLGSRMINTSNGQKGLSVSNNDWFKSAQSNPDNFKASIATKTDKWLGLTSDLSYPVESNGKFRTIPADVVEKAIQAKNGAQNAADYSNVAEQNGPIKVLPWQKQLFHVERNFFTNSQANDLILISDKGVIGADSSVLNNIKRFAGAGGPLASDQASEFFGKLDRLDKAATFDVASTAVFDALTVAGLGGVGRVLGKVGVEAFKTSFKEAGIAMAAKDGAELGFKQNVARTFTALGETASKVGAEGAKVYVTGNLAKANLVATGLIAGSTAYNNGGLNAEQMIRIGADAVAMPGISLLRTELGTQLAPKMSNFMSKLDDGRFNNALGFAGNVAFTSALYTGGTAIANYAT
ncbi:MAG: hypothetical protein JNN05_06355, partial [Candidatus Omnitrophica bacterium]|nr:hypothetical protein [Candidatus Omnitrophota bacterium]